MHVLDFIAMVTVIQHAAYYCVRNTMYNVKCDVCNLFCAQSKLMGIFF